VRTVTIAPVQGKTLDEAYTAAEAIQPEYQVVPRSGLRLDEATGHLKVDGGGEFELTPLALTKLIRPTGLPARYMLLSPNDVAAYNFNYWAPRQKGNVQLAILGEKCIGAMSENCRPIAHTRVITLLSDYLKAERGDAGVLNFREYTLRNEDLRLRFTVPGIAPVEPRKGDIVQVGLDLVNIESVKGYLDVQGCFYRLICTNGMVDRRIGFARRAQSLDWQNHDSILQQALRYFTEATEKMTGFGRYLPALTGATPPAFIRSEDAEGAHDRKAWAKDILHLGHVSSTYIPDFLTELQAEEPTFYGVYNALTRLGRDSKEPVLRLQWEKAAAALLTPTSAVKYGYNGLTVE